MDEKVKQKLKDECQGIGMRLAPNAFVSLHEGRTNLNFFRLMLQANREISSKPRKERHEEAVRAVYFIMAQFSNKKIHYKYKENFGDLGYHFLTGHLSVSFFSFLTVHAALTLTGKEPVNKHAHQKPNSEGVKTVMEIMDSCLNGNAYWASNRAELALQPEGTPPQLQSMPEHLRLITANVMKAMEQLPLNRERLTTALRESTHMNSAPWPQSLVGEQRDDVESTETPAQLSASAAVYQPATNQPGVAQPQYAYDATGTGSSYYQGRGNYMYDQPFQYQQLQGHYPPHYQYR